jgi:hypothetical protein
MEIFADSMETIADAHRRAAELIIGDYGIEDAIPPLLALLHIAAYGKYGDMSIGDEKFRALFSRESVIGSDWYINRLKKYQTSQIEHLMNGISYLGNDESDGRTSILNELNFVRTNAYVDGLIGTIGL